MIPFVQSRNWLSQFQPILALYCLPPFAGGAQPEAELIRGKALPDGAAKAIFIYVHVHVWTVQTMVTHSICRRWALDFSPSFWCEGCHQVLLKSLATCRKRGWASNARFRYAHLIKLRGAITSCNISQRNYPSHHLLNLNLDPVSPRRSLLKTISITIAPMDNSTDAIEPWQFSRNSSSRS